MRILHIIPSLRKGGAERLCMDICAQLAKQPGNTVKLVYLNPIVEYDIMGVPYMVRHLPASVQLSLTKKAVYNTANLESFIQSYKPDVIHTHLFEAEIVSRSITYKHAKWFSHCHDNMRQLENLGIQTLLSKQRITEYYEKRYLLSRYRANGGNKFIAISNHTKLYFERVLPTDLRHITLLNNAINFARFVKPDNYKKKKRAAIELVTTGSLVDKKNQTFLIDVVDDLVKQAMDVHLHVLGDGPNRNMLQQKINLLGLGNNITLHGNVAKVEEFLWNSDIYVHPAYYEPFGLAIVEAMAAGLPAVCLDGKGNRDIINDGQNGFIIPQQHIAAFSGKIIALTGDNALRERIIKASLQTAQQLDIATYTEKLMYIYRS